MLRPHSCAVIVCVYPLDISDLDVGICRHMTYVCFLSTFCERLSCIRLTSVYNKGNVASV